jgi:dedA family protein
MHSFVPEEQLEEKILEYGEYIKFGLIILVILACLYILVKWYIKKRKNDNSKQQQV